jgi:D-alanyl-D-alanine carboxypeptidase/D-alanyl-D-alanine-endopeptidase (penicillin-binding protein 4)
MGAKKYGEGSFKTSSKAIKNVLHNKFTINTSTLHIADSSGLSKYNAATPNHFIRLLQAIHNDSYLKKDVAKILSKPGEKGTLKNRLTASDLRHNVVAKTGTLRNSSALAGYIVTKTGKDLAFVFMVNNMIYNDGQVKQLTDELCEILVNLG